MPRLVALDVNATKPPLPESTGCVELPLAGSLIVPTAVVRLTCAKNRKRGSLMNTFV